MVKIKKNWLTVSVVVVSVLVLVLGLAVIVGPGSDLFMGYTRLVSYQTKTVDCISDGNSLEECADNQGIVARDVTYLNEKYNNCLSTYGKDVTAVLTCFDEEVLNYTPIIEANIKEEAVSNFEAGVVALLPKADLLDLKITTADSKEIAFNEVKSFKVLPTDSDLSFVPKGTVDLMLYFADGTSKKVINVVDLVGFVHY
ncbi:hypothetical protein GF354_04715 [Candidatus Peregrinibacteria bacterium]|nr:hypothetical protein [Candidatus Peregrinibacteria bacterium]